MQTPRQQKRPDASEENRRWSRVQRHDARARSAAWRAVRAALGSRQLWMEQLAVIVSWLLMTIAAYYGIALVVMLLFLAAFDGATLAEGVAVGTFFAFTATWFWSGIRSLRSMWRTSPFVQLWERAYSQARREHWGAAADDAL
jgi:ABC-type multidrug transport system fused ATPase/permease subunit